MKRSVFVLLFVLASWSLPVSAESTPAASEIIRSVLASDPWGLTGAQVKARVTLTDKRGSQRSLEFVAASKRHDPPLSMSIVRFSAPPDLAGAGFLQIQNRSGDDDRYLFLPALRRARRISGNLRANAFMGTDFTFADLDRRDLRDGKARVVRSEKVGSSPCYVLDILPQRDDSQYSHLELWVRKDNFLTLRMEMYDRSSVHIKSFEAREVKRVSGSWFVSKSLMTDHKTHHSTLLVLENIEADAQLPDSEFSVRALERP